MQLPPLTPEQRLKPHRFELRIAAMFALLFVPQGIHLPYFPLWLESRGFDAGQIGLALSAPLFARVITTPLITAYADRARDRVHVLIACVVAALLISSLYLFEPSYAAILAISIALAIAWTPHSPLVDSLALSGVRRFGSNYPSMRIWGSIAFLLANFLGGLVLARTGPAAVPVMICLALLATLAAALALPRLGRPRLSSPLSASGLQEAPSLMNRYFLFFAAGAGLIVGSHAFLYGFSSIYWKGLGISDAVVGLLWAESVLAEVLVFVIFTRVFGAYRPTTLLAISGFAALLRWLALPLVWPLGLGVPGFFVVQALHAFSTGLLLIGVQKLIAIRVGETQTGAAQGIVFFANGISMAAFTLASGPLFDWGGAIGFYVMAVVASVGLGFVLLARASSPERGNRR